MMTRSFASVFAGIVLAFTLSNAGCGSSNPKPQPLSRHFEDKYIVSLPTAEQDAAVAGPQTAYESAKREQAKANADYDASRVQLDVAANEKKAAEIDVNSAKSRKTAADASADQTRIATATAELQAATKYAEALKVRLTYLQAYRAWLETLLYYTQENMYWAESKYELAKATLAKNNNIQPKGFVYDNFANQQADRQAKVGQRKATSEAKRKAALDARAKWMKLQAEADKLTGKPSNFDDPMANATTTGTSTKQDGGELNVGGGGSETDGLMPKAEDAVNSTKPAIGGSTSGSTSVDTGTDAGVDGSATTTP